MKRYLITDEWSIREDGFHTDYLRMTESVFSLGNGRIGQRGNFEEPYSSDSYQACFVAGVPYLDKTRTGWWKNGFPTYYTRIPRAANWSRVRLRLFDEELDLARWGIDQYSRELDMRRGIAYRDMEVTSPRGKSLRIHVEHLTHMAQPDLCLVKYRVTSLNYTGKLSLMPLIEANLKDHSEVTGERVWNILTEGTTPHVAYLHTQTRHEDAQVCYALSYRVEKNHRETPHSPIRIEKEDTVGFSVGIDVKPGDTVSLESYVAITSSLYYERKALVETCTGLATGACAKGWDALTEEHCRAWEDIWREADVTIEGDPEAQQGIRYCIFQLYQTYRGDDPRLNIGPKGFTGEKYGGNTYWNTELCCVPYFLLATSRPIAENLLRYRYNQLPQAIANARALGIGGGAALYPQVTSNGDECHNEWEITFEEIHRNNIIIHAITRHASTTGSMDYIAACGLEVMIAICRYWSRRVSFSEQRGQYVILGVTGPDEYQNNVDNNWYTNYSCVQCLKSTLKAIRLIAAERPEDYARICRTTGFNPAEESARWEDIIRRMYLPEDKERGIFVQNDGFMDKELHDTSAIPPEERPLNQHWSWDRILRSCYIKQADVLLGLYLYGRNFDTDTLRRNFRFYAPMTVHESSLSPHIHSILAARIGDMEQAYNLFMHATRMDLDDYNNEAEQGLHVTSMPGAWMALVSGFLQTYVIDGTLCLSPRLPSKWQGYTLRLNFRKRTLRVRVTKEGTDITLLEGEPLTVRVCGEERMVGG